MADKAAINGPKTLTRIQTDCRMTDSKPGIDSGGSVTTLLSALKDEETTSSEELIKDKTYIQNTKETSKDAGKKSTGKVTLSMGFLRQTQSQLLKMKSAPPAKTKSESDVLHRKSKDGDRNSSKMSDTGSRLLRTTTASGQALDNNLTTHDKMAGKTPVMSPILRKASRKENICSDSPANIRSLRNREKLSILGMSSSPEVLSPLPSPTRSEIELNSPTISDNLNKSLLTSLSVIRQSKSPSPFSDSSVASASEQKQTKSKAPCPSAKVRVHASTSRKAEPEMMSSEIKLGPSTAITSKDKDRSSVTSATHPVTQRTLQQSSLSAETTTEIPTHIHRTAQNRSPSFLPVVKRPLVRRRGNVCSSSRKTETSLEVISANGKYIPELGHTKHRVPDTIDNIVQGNSVSNNKSPVGHSSERIRSTGTTKPLDVDLSEDVSLGVTSVPQSVPKMAGNQMNTANHVTSGKDTLLTTSSHELVKSKDDDRPFCVDEANGIVERSGYSGQDGVDCSRIICDIYDEVLDEDPADTKQLSKKISDKFISGQVCCKIDVTETSPHPRCVATEMLLQVEPGSENAFTKNDGKSQKKVKENENIRKKERSPNLLRHQKEKLGPQGRSQPVHTNNDGRRNVMPELANLQTQKGRTTHTSSRFSQGRQINDSTETGTASDRVQPIQLTSVHGQTAESRLPRKAETKTAEAGTSRSGKRSDTSKHVTVTRDDITRRLRGLVQQKGTSSSSSVLEVKSMTSTRESSVDTRFDDDTASVTSDVSSMTSSSISSRSATRPRAQTGNTLKTTLTNKSQESNCGLKLNNSSGHRNNAATSSIVVSRSSNMPSRRPLINPKNIGKNNLKDTTMKTVPTKGHNRTLMGKGQTQSGVKCGAREITQINVGKRGMGANTEDGQMDSGEGVGDKLVPKNIQGYRQEIFEKPGSENRKSCHVLSDNMDERKFVDEDVEDKIISRANMAVSDIIDKKEFEILVCANTEDVSGEGKEADAIEGSEERKCVVCNDHCCHNSSGHGEIEDNSYKCDSLDKNNLVNNSCSNTDLSESRTNKSERARKEVSLSGQIIPPAEALGSRNARPSTTPRVDTLPLVMEQTRTTSYAPTRHKTPDGKTLKWGLGKSKLGESYHITAIESGTASGVKATESDMRKPSIARQREGRRDEEKERGAHTDNAFKRACLSSRLRSSCVDRQLDKCKLNKVCGQIHLSTNGENTELDNGVKSTSESVHGILWDSQDVKIGSEAFHGILSDSQDVKEPSKSVHGILLDNHDLKVASRIFNGISSDSQSVKNTSDCFNGILSDKKMSEFPDCVTSFDIITQRDLFRVENTDDKSESIPEAVLSREDNSEFSSNILPNSQTDVIHLSPSGNPPQKCYTLSNQPPDGNSVYNLLPCHVSRVNPEVPADPSCHVDRIMNCPSDIENMNTILLASGDDNVDVNYDSLQMTFHEDDLIVRRLADETIFVSSNETHFNNTDSQSTRSRLVRDELSSNALNRGIHFQEENNGLPNVIAKDNPHFSLTETTAGTDVVVGAGRSPVPLYEPEHGYLRVSAVYQSQHGNDDTDSDSADTSFSCFHGSSYKTPHITKSLSESSDGKQGDTISYGTPPHSNSEVRDGGKEEQADVEEELIVECRLGSKLLAEISRDGSLYQSALESVLHLQSGYEHDSRCEDIVDDYDITSADVADDGYDVNVDGVDDEGNDSDDAESIASSESSFQSATSDILMAAMSPPTRELVLFEGCGTSQAGEGMAKLMAFDSESLELAYGDQGEEAVSGDNTVQENTYFIAKQSTADIRHPTAFHHTSTPKRSLHHRHSVNPSHNTRSVVSPKCSALLRRSPGSVDDGLALSTSTSSTAALTQQSTNVDQGKKPRADLEGQISVGETRLNRATSLNDVWRQREVKGDKSTWNSTVPRAVTGSRGRWTRQIPHPRGMRAVTCSKSQTPSPVPFHKSFSDTYSSLELDSETNPKIAGNLLLLSTCPSTSSPSTCEAQTTPRAERKSRQKNMIETQVASNLPVRSLSVEPSKSTPNRSRSNEAAPNGKTLNAKRSAGNQPLINTDERCHITTRLQGNQEIRRNSSKGSKLVLKDQQQTSLTAPSQPPENPDSSMKVFSKNMSTTNYKSSSVSSSQSKRLSGTASINERVGLIDKIQKPQPSETMCSLNPAESAANQQDRCSQDIINKTNRQQQKQDNDMNLHKSNLKMDIGTNSALEKTIPSNKKDLCLNHESGSLNHECGSLNHECGSLNHECGSLNHEFVSLNIEDMSALIGHSNKVASNGKCTTKASESTNKTSSDSLPYLMPLKDNPSQESEPQICGSDKLEGRSLQDYSDLNENQLKEFSLHPTGAPLEARDIRASLFESGYSSDIKSPDVRSPVHEIENAGINSVQIISDNLESKLDNGNKMDILVPSTTFSHQTDVGSCAQKNSGIKIQHLVTKETSTDNSKSEISLLSSTPEGRSDELRAINVGYEKHTKAELGETQCQETGQGDEDEIAAIRAAGFSESSQGQMCRCNVKTLDKPRVDVNKANATLEQQGVNVTCVCVQVHSNVRQLVCHSMTSGDKTNHHDGTVCNNKTLIDSVTDSDHLEESLFSRTKEQSAFRFDDDLNCECSNNGRLEECNDFRPPSNSLEECNNFRPIRNSSEDCVTFRPISNSYEEYNNLKEITRSTENCNNFRPISNALENCNNFRPISNALEENNSFRPISNALEESNSFRPTRSNYNEESNSFRTISNYNVESSSFRPVSNSRGVVCNISQMSEGTTISSLGQVSGEIYHEQRQHAGRISAEDEITGISKIPSHLFHDSGDRNRLGRCSAHTSEDHIFALPQYELTSGHAEQGVNMEPQELGHPRPCKHIPEYLTAAYSPSAHSDNGSSALDFCFSRDTSPIKSEDNASNLLVTNQATEVKPCCFYDNEYRNSNTGNTCAHAENASNSSCLISNGGVTLQEECNFVIKQDILTGNSNLDGRTFRVKREVKDMMPTSLQCCELPDMIYENCATFEGNKCISNDGVHDDSHSSCKDTDVCSESFTNFPRHCLEARSGLPPLPSVDLTVASVDLTVASVDLTVASVKTCGDNVANNLTGNIERLGLALVSGADTGNSWHVRNKVDGTSLDLRAGNAEQMDVANCNVHIIGAGNSTGSRHGVNSNKLSIPADAHNMCSSGDNNESQSPRRRCLSPHCEGPPREKSPFILEIVCELLSKVSSNENRAYPRVKPPLHMSEADRLVLSKVIPLTPEEQARANGIRVINKWKSMVKKSRVVAIRESLKGKLTGANEVKSNLPPPVSPTPPRKYKWARGESGIWKKVYLDDNNRDEMQEEQQEPHGSPSMNLHDEPFASHPVNKLGTQTDDINLTGEVINRSQCSSEMTDGVFQRLQTSDSSLETPSTEYHRGDVGQVRASQGCTRIHDDEQPGREDHDKPRDGRITHKDESDTLVTSTTWSSEQGGANASDGKCGGEPRDGVLSLNMLTSQSMGVAGVQRCANLAADEEYSNLGQAEVHPNLEADERYPNLEADERYPNLEADERYPNLGAVERYPNLGAGERYPNLGAGERYPNLGAGERYPNLEADREYPRIVAEKDYLNLVADEENTNIGADEGYLNLGAAEGHLNLGADKEHANLGADKGHPNLEADEEHPNLGADEEHPNLGADEEHPNLGADEEHAILGKNEANMNTLDSKTREVWSEMFEHVTDEIHIDPRSRQIDSDTRNETDDEIATRQPVSVELDARDITSAEDLTNVAESIHLTFQNVENTNCHVLSRSGDSALKCDSSSGSWFSTAINDSSFQGKEARMGDSNNVETSQDQEHQENVNHEQQSHEDFCTQEHVNHEEESQEDFCTQEHVNHEQQSQEDFCTQEHVNHEEESQEDFCTQEHVNHEEYLQEDSCTQECVNYEEHSQKDCCTKMISSDGDYAESECPELQMTSPTSETDSSDLCTSRTMRTQCLNHYESTARLENNVLAAKLHNKVSEQQKIFNLPVVCQEPEDSKQTMIKDCEEGGPASEGSNVMGSPKEIMAVFLEATDMENSNPQCCIDHKSSHVAELVKGNSAQSTNEPISNSREECDHSDAGISSTKPSLAQKNVSLHSQAKLTNSNLNACDKSHNSNIQPGISPTGQVFHEDGHLSVKPNLYAVRKNDLASSQTETVSSAFSKKAVVTDILETDKNIGRGVMKSKLSENVASNVRLLDSDPNVTELEKIKPKKHTWPTVAESLKRFQKSIAGHPPSGQLLRKREQQMLISACRDSLAFRNMKGVNSEHKARQEFRDVVRVVVKGHSNDVQSPTADNAHGYANKTPVDRCGVILNADTNTDSKLPMKQVASTISGCGLNRATSTLIEVSPFTLSSSRMNRSQALDNERLSDERIQPQILNPKDSPDESLASDNSHSSSLEPKSQITVGDKWRWTPATDDPEHIFAPSAAISLSQEVTDFDNPSPGLPDTRLGQPFSDVSSSGVDKGDHKGNAKLSPLSVPDNARALANVMPEITSATYKSEKLCPQQQQHDHQHAMLLPLSSLQPHQQSQQQLCGLIVETTSAPASEPEVSQISSDSATSHSSTSVMATTTTDSPEQTVVLSPRTGAQRHMPSAKLISVSVWDTHDGDKALRHSRRLWATEEIPTLAEISEIEEVQASHDVTAGKDDDPDPRDQNRLLTRDDCQERVRASRSPVRPHCKERKAPRRSLSLPSGGLSYGDVKILYKDGHFVMMDASAEKGAKSVCETTSMLEDVSEENERADDLTNLQVGDSSSWKDVNDDCDVESKVRAEILSLLERGISDPQRLSAEGSLSFDGCDTVVATRRTRPAVSGFLSLPRRKGHHGPRPVSVDEARLSKYYSKSQQSLVSQAELDRRRVEEQEASSLYRDGPGMKRNTSFTEAMGSAVILNEMNGGIDTNRDSENTELCDSGFDDSNQKDNTDDSRIGKSRSKGPGFFQRMLQKRKGSGSEKSLSLSSFSIKSQKNDLSSSSVSLASTTSTSQQSTSKQDNRDSSIGRKMSFRGIFKRKNSTDESARKTSSSEEPTSPLSGTVFIHNDTGATSPPSHSQKCFNQNIAETDLFREGLARTNEADSFSHSQFLPRSSRTPTSNCSSQSSLYYSLSQDDSESTPVALKAGSRRARSSSGRTRTHGRISSGERLSGDSLSEYDLSSPELRNSDGAQTPRSLSPYTLDLSMESDQTLIASPTVSDRLSPVYQKLTSSPQGGRSRSKDGETFQKTSTGRKDTSLTTSTRSVEMVSRNSNDSGIQNDGNINSSAESIQAAVKLRKSKSPSPTTERPKSDTTVRWADLLEQVMEPSAVRYRQDATKLRRQPRPRSDIDEKLSDADVGKENEDDSDEFVESCEGWFHTESYKAANSMGNISASRAAAATESMPSEGTNISTTGSVSDVRVLMRSRESLSSLVEMRRPGRDGAAGRLAKIRRLSTPQPITVRIEKPKPRPVKAAGYQSGVLTHAHSMPENLDKLTRQNYLSLIGSDAQSINSQHSGGDDSSEDSEYSMDYNTEGSHSTRSSQITLAAFDHIVGNENLTYAEALWDHVTMDPDELGFRAGDLIRVKDATDKHWWFGVIDDHKGWFPATFVRLRVNQDIMEEEQAYFLAEEEALIVVEHAGNLAKSSNYVGKIQARCNVVNEIISAEREYVKHLTDVVEGYVKQARKRPEMFPREKVAIIFSNIEEIFQFATDLLIQLEKSVNHEEPHMSELGQCFLDKVKGFEMYSDYCNNHSAACEELRELYRNKRYRHFFEACRLLQEMIEIPLEGFLLTPVQKICKYHLQLAELLKFTPPDHADFCQVQGALDAMKKIAMLVNERKRKMESLEKLAAWQLLVDDWEGPDILEGSSELIYSGELNKINHAGWSQERYFFLFDHQLVYCKKDLLKKSSFCFKGRISMDSCEVISLPDGRDSQYNVSVRNAWKLHDTNHDKWYLLVAKTPAIRQRWLKAFQDERRRVKDDTENNFNIPNHAKQAVINSLKQKTSLSKPKGKTSKLHHVNSMTQVISNLNRVSGIATLPRSKSRHKVKHDESHNKHKKINWFFLGKGKS